MRITNIIIIIIALTLLCVALYIIIMQRTKYVKLKKIYDDCNNELRQNIKSNEKLRADVNSISELSKAGQEIIKNTYQKDIYQATYKGIQKFVKADTFGIGIINGLQNSIDFSNLIIENEPIPFARYNLDINNNLSVYCFHHGEIIIIDDYQSQAQQYIDNNMYKPDKSLQGSALYIPLYDNQIIFGVMAIFNNQKNYFKPDKIKIIQRITSYLETAIINSTTEKKSTRHARMAQERNLELERTLSNLRKSQQSLQRMSIAVMYTDNAVMILDNKRNISWVNNAFTRVYGYTLEEYVKDSVYYANALRQKDAVEYYTFAFDNSKSVSFTLPHLRKNGEEIWIQTSLTPILDSNNNITQVVAVDTDVSSLKRAEQKIIKQRNEIENKNKDITKSIEYASTIQQALMTGSTRLKKLFKNSFTINLPKDIVSGDFLWIGEKFGRKYIALCDCAGHGVPGAFVSVMGKVFLDEILQSLKLEDMPSTIIHSMNDKLYQAVNSLTNKVGGIDGMDMAICVFNSRNTVLNFAGAYRPLFIVRDGELIVIEPDKYSIGNITYTDDFQFKDHTIQLKENDFLLICSDGYSDQFGEQSQKKLGKRNLYKLITNAAALKNAEKISQFLYESHVNWRGNLEQIDDISVVGIINSNEDEEQNMLYDDSNDE